jgi:hypothetical protein
MNITDLFGSLEKFVNAAHLLEIFGVLRGDEPATDAPSAAKGLAGILGTKDERVMLELLGKFPQAEQKAFFAFMTWMLKNDGSAVQKLEAFIIRNNFFTFVTKKHNPGESKELGTSKHVFKRTSGPRDFTHTINRKQFSTPGESPAIILLVSLIETIQTNGIDAKGHKASLAAFKSMSLPVRQVGEPGFWRLVEQAGATSTEWSTDQAAYLARIAPIMKRRIIRQGDEFQKSIITHAQARKVRTNDRSLWNKFVRSIGRLGF